MAVSASDLISDARNYASSVYADAASLVDSAVGRLSVTYPLAPTSNWPGINVDELVAGDVPVFNDTFNAPVNRATLPAFEGVTKPDGELAHINPVADFDTSKLWQGDVPLFDIEPFTRVAPTVSAITLPAAPVLMDIPFPDIDEQVKLPTLGALSLPTFDPQQQADMPELPPDLAAAYKAQYKAALPEMRAFIDAGMQEFLSVYVPDYEENRAKLMERINRAYADGTGLSETVEQNMYDRGRARAEAEQHRLTSQVVDGAAQRGFFVPDGALIAGMMQAHAQAAMANAHYASEVTIERAKLELSHLQFIMQLSDGVRASALQFATQYAGTLLQVNEQALQHGQTIANFMAETYNLTVKRFEAALHYLSVQVQLFEAQYKAALADLERFKIEAEVAKLRNDINKTEVDIYLARLSAQKTQVDIYAAQIGALETQIKAEVSAVTAFGEEVRAYVARVGAKEAEFGVYEAALSGNKTLADVYATQVQAYSSRLSAEKTRQDVQVAAAEAAIAYNRNLSEQYRTEIAAYQAELTAESTRFDSSAKAYLAGLDGYKADLAARVSVLEGQLKTAALEKEQVSEQYRLEAAFRTEKSKVLNDASYHSAQVAISGAGVYTTIAAAALQSQNSMVQVIENK